MEKKQKASFNISKHWLVILKAASCFIKYSGQIKGYCTPNQKLTYFVLYYQHLFSKITCAAYSKVSKELKNGSKIKVGQAVLELNKNIILIHNLKTVRPTKIVMLFLSSFDNFL